MAQECIELFGKYCFEHERRILMNVFTHTKDEIDKGNWFFADHLTASEIAKELTEGKKMAFFSSYNRERLCAPSVRSEVVKNTERIVQINYGELLGIIRSQNNDFSDVMKFKEENEPLMRAKIKKTLGLDF